MRSELPSARNKRGTGRPLFGPSLLFSLLIILVVGLLAGAFFLFEFEKPTITLQQEPRFLGGNIKIPFLAKDARSGIRSVTVSLEQKGASRELYSKRFPRTGWFGKAGPPELSDTVTADTLKAGFKDGDAQLIVAARDFSLWGMFLGNETVLRSPVTIDTKAPRITTFHTQRYITPGSSGIAIYSLSEPSTRHGVMLNDIFFPGYPMAGKENRYISYFALRWDAREISGCEITAMDQAGNEGKIHFTMTNRKAREKKDSITIGDDFLNRKIPEFQEHYPELKGSMIDKYIYVNNEIRRRNNQTIKEACSHSEPIRLWRDRFLRMPGAPRAGFADQRTYFYQGKAIDNQVHLGVDIASSANVAIKAANKGKVVFAEYLGIYGNTVILDHGQGLFSLYSHLSRIDTEKDQIVDQGTVIGHSGTTGMAGGDHLHFGILVDSVFISPVEWWDQHWIDVNINVVLNDNTL